MNNRSYIIVLLCGLFLAGGFKKYLDVKPEASYTDVQVYGNEKALQQALIGLYISLADKNLYGANLSTTVIELLAQRYKPISDNMGMRNLSPLNDYQYSNTVIQALFDTTWKTGYATILAANVFLSKIDNSIQSKIISQENGNLLKGEAIAIRAMMHFDLLRLFGPVYSSGSATKAIPYYTLADAKQQPILTASAAMDKIMADLTEAATLLAHDPAIGKGVVYSADFYSGYRNQRLNYYAVKGLMARAYLWAGKKDEARTAALAVLNEGEKWFPWTTPDSAAGVTTDYLNGLNPDRVFYKEVLFGVYNPNMYNIYNTYFSPAVYDGAILAPDTTRLSTVFESNLNDPRFGLSWKREGKSYRTFFKFADITTKTKPWRFVQPLLRKSELYYLLAEVETDPVKALEYLNTVRRNRAWANLPPTANITVELRKEYQKEFFGEGQLFFYYKRINATGVLYANSSSAYYTVNPMYVVPLPFSETNTR